MSLTFSTTNVFIMLRLNVDCKTKITKRELDEKRAGKYLYKINVGGAYFVENFYANNATSSHCYVLVSFEHLRRKNV